MSRVMMFAVRLRTIESYFIKVFEIATFCRRIALSKYFENLDEITFYSSKTNSKHHHSIHHD